VALARTNGKCPEEGGSLTVPQTFGELLCYLLVDDFSLIVKGIFYFLHDVRTKNA
jgi:hypothetical protein